MPCAVRCSGIYIAWRVASVALHIVSRLWIGSARIWGMIQPESGTGFAVNRDWISEIDIFK